MGWILFAIGIAWVMLGTMMVFATETIEKGLYERLRGKNQKFLSPLPILGGVLLFISASASSQSGFIAVLGILLIVKGALFLFSPKNSGEKIAHWWFNAPRKTHQTCGVIVIVLGILVLASLSTLIN